VRRTTRKSLGGRVLIDAGGAQERVVETLVLLMVQPDSFLTLHYRISLADGQKPVIDTFAERPATLQMGTGQLAQPLESNLLGLREGERRLFKLGAGEAFGPRNPELLQRIRRDLFDTHAARDEAFFPGDLIDFPRPDGGRYAGVLKEMHPDHVLVDFNHPLAGRAIDFEVEVISVL
jgi:FKBP-type peptidyl-prolyl cis-trans isomerase SlpA